MGFSVNNLYLFEEAQKDLAEIKIYITEEEENQRAVLDVISKITKKIRILKKYAYAGTKLSEDPVWVQIGRKRRNSYVIFLSCFSSNISKTLGIWKGS